MRGVRRVATAMVAAAGLALAAPAGTAGATSSWPTSHGDMGRTGVDPSEAPLSPLGHAWADGLDGSAVYGSPVVFGGRVFVADEADQVYALDPSDGGVLWHADLGQPLHNVAAQAGCGNIDPLGITSTPVVDTSTGVVYVVAEVSTGGATPVHHQLVGLDAATGRQVVSSPADPPLPAGESPVDIQQRASLALGGGRVYVGYGGLSGDCGAYHGWVVGVDEQGARPNVAFEAAPDGQGGAVWEAGGPAVTPSGDVVATTGNPNPDTPAKTYTESAVLLGPDLSVLHAYQSPASGDADLASDSPTLLADGDVFVVGKADVAYVLRGSDLTPLETITGVCGSDPDGANAYDATTSTVYVPCRGGAIQAVHLAGSGSLGWRGGGSNGPPVLVDGGLFTVPYGQASPSLTELDPATGNVVQRIAVGAAVPTFTSPSVADGLVLLGTVNGVVAFDGPNGLPPATPPPAACTSPAPAGSMVLAARDGGAFPLGGAPFCGSVAGVRLAAPVVAVAARRQGGYWMAGADGGVYGFAAPFEGSLGGQHLNAPIVAMAATPNGGGYWLVAADGGVFAYGDATFHGSTGDLHLAAPVVAVAVTPSGGGYWLIAADGGVFAFGDAAFAGSTGGTHLAAPVVAATASPSGGYWLVAADGGVFAFGGAAFAGSTGGMHLNQPIVAAVGDRTGGGYRLVAADGGVFAFGDAGFPGSLGSVRLAAPIVGGSGS